jgi:hypothetical protein
MKTPTERQFHRSFHWQSSHLFHQKLTESLGISNGIDDGKFCLHLRYQ